MHFKEALAIEEQVLSFYKDFIHLPGPIHLEKDKFFFGLNDVYSVVDSHENTIGSVRFFIVDETSSLINFDEIDFTEVITLDNVDTLYPDDYKCIGKLIEYGFRVSSKINVSEDCPQNSFIIDKGISEGKHIVFYLYF